MPFSFRSEEKRAIAGGIMFIMYRFGYTKRTLNCFCVISFLSSAGVPRSSGRRARRNRQVWRLPINLVQARQQPLPHVEVVPPDQLLPDPGLEVVRRDAVVNRGVGGLEDDVDLPIEDLLD